MITSISQISKIKIFDKNYIIKMKNELNSDNRCFIRTNEYVFTVMDIIEKGKLNIDFLFTTKTPSSKEIDLYNFLKNNEINEIILSFELKIFRKETTKRIRKDSIGYLFFEKDKIDENDYFIVDGVLYLHTKKVFFDYKHTKSLPMMEEIHSDYGGGGNNSNDDGTKENKNDGNSISFDSYFEKYSTFPFREARVYNVLQGNMNSLHFSDGGEEKIILFDQGSRSRVPFNNNSPKNFNYLNVDTIIISHDHLDHYSLLDCRNCSNLNHIFIPPSKPKMLALININYVAVKKRHFISKQQVSNSTIFTTNILKLLFINGKNINNQALCLNYDDGKTIKLFTGDVLYDYTINSLNLYTLGNKDINIVVNHHMGYCNINNNTQTIKGNLAIASFKYGSYSSVPNTITENYFKNNFTNILKTPNISVYYYFVL